MAYDEGVAQGVRERLSGESGLTERRMFGGLGFMLDGRMAVAAGSNGGVMVRVPEDAPQDPLLRPMVMRGRPMSGWMTTDGPVDDADLDRIVALGVRTARALGPKDGSRPA